jgi:hypothetical protein
MRPQDIRLNDLDHFVYEDRKDIKSFKSISDIINRISEARFNKVS